MPTTQRDHITRAHEELSKIINERTTEEWQSNVDDAVQRLYAVIRIASELVPKIEGGKGFF